MPSPTRPRTIQSRIGAAADGHQRLRGGLGQVAEPGPRAAGHDERDVGQPLGADDVGEGVQPRRSATRRRPRAPPRSAAPASGRARARAASPRAPRAGSASRAGGPGRRCCAPPSRARRRSPSVTTPTTRPLVVDEHAHRGGVPVDDLHDLPQRRGVGGRRPAPGRARSSSPPGASTKGLARGTRRGAAHDVDDARRGVAVAVGVGDLGGARPVRRATGRGRGPPRPRPRPRRRARRCRRAAGRAGGRRRRRRGCRRLAASMTPDDELPTTTSAPARTTG